MLRLFLFGNFSRLVNSFSYINTMDFKLTSEYVPTGDQPKAIEQLVKGVEAGERHQTLLGVTGSGKTFTMANVVAQTNRPTQVHCPNKTTAARWCAECTQYSP